MPWATSNRRSRLPKNWPVIQRYIIARDPWCKINGPKCSRRSTQADHIVHGDNHSLTNLQGVCRECHAVKSAQEGAEARKKKYSRKYKR